jgi:glutathione synthase/RimK-type ligase-like ATP-grasp enzyme
VSAIHIIIVEKRTDFRWPDPGSRVMTAEEFVSEQGEGRTRQRKVINLCRSYDYLSMGYYCSLLAEARGDRVTPSVETILDLQQKKADSPRLAGLNRLIGGLEEVPRSVNSLSFHVFFGQIEDPELSDLARRSFELFRCPLLEVDLERVEGSSDWKIAQLTPLDPRDVDPARDGLFLSALERFTRRTWRPALVMSAPRMDLAILHDPRDPLPPSSAQTLQNFIRVGRSMNIEVELIEKKDFSRLTQFDALLIRETTAVDHHTFKFAKKAESEGMPVLDDPTSILRCTNKAYLAELLRDSEISTPHTRLISRRTLPKLADELEYPVVLKVPDGSFSRNVKKAENWKQFQDTAQSMFKESEIILVQEFMYTDFDWRVGILAGEPLFVAKYFMTRNHWQILKHSADGQLEEGRTEAVAIEDTPKAVLDAAIRCASLVGDGLYGVDLKEHASGVYVIEINDNPNIDAGMEDAILGDDLYRKLLGHLLRQFEAPFIENPPVHDATVSPHFLAAAASTT